MSKGKIILSCVIAFVILSSSSVSSAGDSRNEVELSTFPQVSINVTNTTQVNASYSGIIISTAQGVVGAKFSDKNWVITNDSAGYHYESSFDLSSISGTDYADLYARAINSTSNNLNLPSDVPSLPVTLNINISKYDGSITSLKLLNKSTSSGGVFTGINDSTMKLSFALSFDVTSGMISSEGISIFLIQSIAGSENSKQLNYTMVSTRSGTSLYQGIAMAQNDLNNTTKALYWWNDSFLHNGISGSDNVTLIPREEGIYTLFEFKVPANTTGQTTLSQDPYISVSGADVLGGKLVLISRPIVNYLLQNIEFLAGGVLGGSIILGIMYLSYRKRMPDT
ncbi:MAG: hypothetical protein ACYCR7_07010 [Thermoplasmataceae archaeon]